MANGPQDHDPRDTYEQQPKSQHQQVQPPAPTLTMNEQTLAVDLAQAEISQLIATAHQFPRKVAVAVNRIMEMACFDEAAAENSVYALPRAGKAIVGASIGFANIVASAWGNCWDYGRWVHTDRREKVVVAEGIFVDWETNRRLAISEQRRIVDSKGRLFSDDMIIITSKAATSIARRNVILNAVPRGLWFPAYERALFMVRGSEATLAERRDKAVKALAQFGATPQQVFMYLAVRDMGEIGIEHMPTLRGMYAQLRDGTSTPEEMFDPRRMTTTAFDTIDNPLGDQPNAPAAAGPATDAALSAAKEAPAAAGAPAQDEPAQQGQDKPAADTPAKPKAPRKRVEPKTKGADAPTPPAEQQPAQQQPAPAPDKPAATAAQTAPQAGPEPKTSEEYERHAMAYIAAATVVGDLENKWKSERNLRTTCSIVEDSFGRVHGAYTAKIAVLKGGA